MALHLLYYTCTNLAVAQSSKTDIYYRILHIAKGFDKMKNKYYILKQIATSIKGQEPWEFEDG